MKKFSWLMILVAVGMIACSRSEQHIQILSEAERIVSAYPDSALRILEEIDPSDLREDSLKAIYAITIASAHKAGDRSMVSDSLTKHAFGYYRDKDLNRFLQAGDLYALHRFWAGEGSEALRLLDSLISLPGIPECSKIELLRSRMGVGGQQLDGKKNISSIRQLMEIDKSGENQLEYKHQLYLNYAFAGQNDSAIIVLDELIADAHRRNLSEQEFEYKYEKIGILEEAGKYSESNELADYILNHAPENSILMYLHFWKALNLLNMGKYKIAAEQLAIADNYAKDAPAEEYIYYDSFASHLRNMLTFQNEGNIKIIRMSEIYNSQRDRWFRDENTKDLQRQNALKAENRALRFKSESERKTYIIIIISLTAVILAFGAFMLIQKRKHRIVEAEERAETLQRMVDELQNKSLPTDSHETLRRAMLQQLNIIKMVAETPTEQNREMLRKISAIDSSQEGALVNWANVYEIIDNLYSGFYSKLHNSYGDKLTEKEEQVIVLLAAGFSAKEISVITAQSTASIYVRKSTVKKKLEVPEKEDVLLYLRQSLSH